MKKAFFYDTLCGMVYRCMFAGLDECGHAQWVSITPGEESKTLQDVVIDEEMENRNIFMVLEISAEIPVITKDLRITDDLRKHVRKSDLGMFSSIQKEEKYTLNKEEN